MMSITCIKMAANAALLDELMGLHRNVAPGEGRSQDQDWKDDNVSPIISIKVK